MPCDSFRVTKPVEMIRAIYTNNVNFAAQSFITTNLPLHSFYLAASDRSLSQKKHLRPDATEIQTYDPFQHLYGK